MSDFKRKCGYFFISGILLLLYFDPVIANKFTTIGGGVSGSTQSKIEFLKTIAYVVSGIFFISGVLSVVQRNKNAQTLNYTMWKPSAIIFIILSILFALLGVYL